ncbi:MAG TPA: hypothetical protein VMC09_03990 [Anaerolineales bacterium]|nr:hypothetical protein [Anaerolineales bacterium]
MKRLFSLLCLLVFLSACGTTPTPPANGGVEGHVTIGPTCPVVQLNNPCPDKPYQATLAILDPAGTKVLQSFQTDANGYFHIVLAPGNYLLRPKTSGRYPIAHDQPFTVQAGAFTSLDVTYDSGIR